MNTDNSEPLDLEDYLDDDPEIPGQKFFLLSYILPSEKNDLKYPMFKMRGAFKSQEEVDKRVKKLKNLDKVFDIFQCSVGNWGQLLPSSEISKDDSVAVEYRNEKMNTMMKEIKENKEKVDEEFASRMEIMKRKAKEEGTKQFQEYLAFIDEHTKDFKTPNNLSLEEYTVYAEKLTSSPEYLKYWNEVKSCDSEFYEIWRKEGFNETDETKIIEDLTTKLRTFFV